MIHVPEQLVDPEITIDVASERLVYELGQPELPPNYIPPELIAKFAIELIEQNNALDATVFLAAASYTYHRQAHLGLNAAEASAQGDLTGVSEEDLNAYWNFVHNEFNTFNELDFLEPLEYTLSLWEKKKNVTEQMEKEMAQIYGNPGNGGTNRQESMKDELTRKIETARAPDWDKLRYPQVAQALLERLKVDLAVEDHSFDASLHIAAVPFEPFLLTALNEAPHPFLVPMCRSIGLRFAVYEQHVLNALKAPRPETRSNAALILGLRAGDKHLAAMEQAYTNESNLVVRWSLEYAMIVAGKTDLLPQFYEHVNQAIDEKHVDHLIQLFEWLPDDALDGISEKWLVQVADSEKQSLFARNFAMMVLGNIGEKRNISTESINMLLKQSMNEDPSVAEWAHRSVIRQKALDRATVLQYLNRNTTGTEALLNRMLMLTESSDFEFWKSQLSAFASLSDGGKRLTIWGIAQSGKSDAVPMLHQLFDNWQEYRLPISVAVTEIPGVAPSQLLELAARDTGIASVFLAFSAEERDAAAQKLGTMLQSAPFGEKLAAAQLAKMFVVKEQKTALWANTMFHDSEYYPHDSVLRNSTLDALITIAIMDAIQKNSYDFNTPQLDKR